MIYREYEDFMGGKMIVRENFNGTETFIPLDPANSDYQRYLRWLNGEDETGTLS